MTSKISLHFDLGCHFCKIQAHTAILRTFSHILSKFPDFARIFTKSKVLGVAVAPTPPTPVDRGHQVARGPVPKMALTWLDQCLQGSSQKWMSLSIIITRWHVNWTNCIFQKWVPNR